MTATLEYSGLCDAHLQRCSTWLLALGAGEVLMPAQADAVIATLVGVVQVAREIQIHSTLHHEHIIALYGAFEDSKHVYLVQEFAVGAPL